MLSHLLCLGLAALGAHGGRGREPFDADWRFQRLGAATFDVPELQCSLPRDTSGLRCYGLDKVAYAPDAASCRQACCQDLLCEVWQFEDRFCWVGPADDCHPEGPRPPEGRDVSAALGQDCAHPYCQPDHDDRAWQPVEVPHDYVAEGVFHPQEDWDHGYLPRVPGWYRKHFMVPSAAGDLAWLTFDGVYRGCLVWLNGVLLAHHASGYTSFHVDLTNCTGALQCGPGLPNVLAVWVNPRRDEGWWYEGGGIYRHVWLDRADPLHVRPDGVFAPAEVTGAISDGGRFAEEARVEVSVEVSNRHAVAMDFAVRSTVTDPDGAGSPDVASATTPPLHLPAGASMTVRHVVWLRGGVRLWGPGHPQP